MVNIWSWIAFFIVKSIEEIWLLITIGELLLLIFDSLLCSLFLY